MKAKRWIQLGAAVFVTVVLGQQRPSTVQATAAAPASALTVSSSVNAYITSHHLAPVGITKDLHTFELFNYSTADQLPNGVVFHYTDNKSIYSARSEADYEINIGWQNAFVHTFIDARTILNIHDIEKGCWGAGPMANHRFVQFELVTARNATEFAQSINNAAWYVAYLADHFGWTLTLAAAHAGIGTLWTHYDVSHYLGGTDHVDPIAYLNQWGYNTTQFLDLANAYYQTQYPSPLNGARGYDKVTNTTAVNLPGVVTQVGRSDGLYSEPYYLSKASLRENHNAQTINGQTVQILQQATTTRSAAAGNTFYQIRLVNGKTYWTDTRAVSVKAFDPILQQTQVNYRARIAQAGRSDGLYPDGPYNTKLSNIYPNTNAPAYDAQVVPVTAEATTKVGTYAQITLNSGQVVWLDKRGLTTDIYDRVTATTALSAVGRIVQTGRHDGLYSAPFLTDDLTLVKNKNAAIFADQAVTVLKAATITGKATDPEGNRFYQIRLNNGNTYWINQAGIQLVTLDQVVATEALNTTGVINEAGRQDGLYSAPWYTDALSITENHNAPAFEGQPVTVLAQATTSRSAAAGNHFYQVQLPDGRKYWLDARGVKAKVYDQVQNAQTVNYTAMINANSTDGLYAHPYNSNADSAVPNTDAKAFAGRGVTVSALGTTSQGTYAQVTLPNGTQKWLDVRGLTKITYDQVLTTTKLDQAATIVQVGRADGLYSAPWYTDAMSVLENHNAALFDQQAVTIIQQATTNRSPVAGNVFDQIRLANGQTYWTDARGVKPVVAPEATFDQVVSRQLVTIKATVVQTDRADGLYSAPYATTVDASIENHDAKALDGQAVTIIQEVTTDRAANVGNAFVQIRLADGTTGWLDARGVQVTP